MGCYAFGPIHRDTYGRIAGRVVPYITGPPAEPETIQSSGSHSDDSAAGIGLSCAQRRIIGEIAPQGRIADDRQPIHPSGTYHAGSEQSHQHRYQCCCDDYQPELIRFSPHFEPLSGINV